jgi:FMN reductase
MRPRIVALGGTLRPSSSGSAALRLCLKVAREHDCDVQLLTGPDLDVPMYDPSAGARSPRAVALLAALRSADGILIASPGYHGSVSGLVKNALDYTEDLRTETRSYLADVPVGCIVSAAGWQAAGATLAALRAIVHALRGWPTPLGVMFNSSTTVFDPNGDCRDEELHAQLRIMTVQVITMAKLQSQRTSAQQPVGLGKYHH